MLSITFPEAILSILMKKVHSMSNKTRYNTCLVIYQLSALYCFNNTSVASDREWFKRRRHKMKIKLTFWSQEIVEELEERKAVPRVWRLNIEGSIHVHTKQWPEDLSMFYQQVTEPCKCLYMGNRQRALYLMQSNTNNTCIVTNLDF